MKTRQLVLCALFIVLITVGAFIKIPVPYVPFSLQFLFINLAGLLLGPKYGPISVILYIIAGLIGLPVFTSGGGFGYVLMPTFGYLLGFIPASFVSGYLSRKLTHKYAGLIAGLCAIPVMYIIAIPYLICIFHFVMDLPIQLTAILGSYFLIFLPGDIFSVFVGSLLNKRLSFIRKT